MVFLNKIMIKEIIGGHVLRFSGQNARLNEKRLNGKPLLDHLCNPTVSNDLYSQLEGAVHKNSPVS